MSFRTSKAESPESAAGIHANYVLYVNDEASGIPDAVFEAQIGSFADPHVLYILAGNPVRRKGLFFETHTNPKLIESWHRFKISAFDTSRVGHELIDEARARWGESSNQWRIRVLGEFPLTDDDTVIPEYLAREALTREIQRDGSAPIWGLDPARKGKDRSALVKRTGRRVIEAPKTWRGLDTMELVGRVYNEWRETPSNELPSAVCVDVIGLGAGVCDRLRELGVPVRSINVAESSSLAEKYANLKAELWFDCRAWFESRGVSLDGHEALMAELIQTEYKEESNGKIRIVPKKETHDESPDLADAFVLTFAVPATTASGNYGGQRAPARKRNIVGLA